MKERFLSLFFAACLVLSACSGVFHTLPVLVSNLSEKDCFVCGAHDEEYWEQENIGILNLNTFDLLPLSINYYENGQLVEDPEGYRFGHDLRMGESWVVSDTDPNRGYSRVEIPAARRTIDPDRVQSKLCQRCLDMINDVEFEDTVLSEFAVVNFLERSVHPIVKGSDWFLTGDFDVNGEFQADGTIVLLIHYCPPRSAYTDKTSAS